MNIQTYTTDFFDSNVYLLEINNKKIMIDCGGTAGWVQGLLNSINFRPNYILLTHGHIDHILALSAFTEPDSKIFIHNADAIYLNDPSFNLSPQLIGQPFVWKGDVFDYQELPQELGIQVIHTPGHTPGSVCLLIGKCLFSGDTLFCGGIGNTSFPGGDLHTEINSIHHLLSLSPDITVYPGHGPTTAIANERNTI